MLYKTNDSRYIRWAYSGMIWNEPDAGRHDAGTARILRRWNKDMLAVENREHCNRTLGLTQQRVCLDFFNNTILVYVDHDEEALVHACSANLQAWSDERASEIARARMAALASLYAELCKTCRTRTVETAFMTTLRGPWSDDCYDPDAGEPLPEDVCARWLQAMNEFTLGAVVNLVFRPPVYSGYLPHDRFDRLLAHLRAWTEALNQSPTFPRSDESPMGLTHNPTSPPAPAPASTAKNLALPFGHCDAYHILTYSYRTKNSVREPSNDPKSRNVSRCAILLRASQVSPS